ncbi:Phosphoglucomutase-2 [Datura stramonium]|uniref:Phosphoglucomutase-2 n=1 Tax=Datura stramonium TaxID=4076 RepID=A0ABS8TRM1_DATST|nr:Phosphoglucomutase-2 [Datura stramonium]
MDATYYTRYDYENVNADGAKELMAHLVKLQSSIDEANKLSFSFNAPQLQTVSLEVCRCTATLDLRSHQASHPTLQVRPSPCAKYPSKGLLSLLNGALRWQVSLPALLRSFLDIGSLPACTLLVATVIIMFPIVMIIKGIVPNVSHVVHADEFEYKDPVDGSVSKHQGIRYLFEDGSRLVRNLPCSSITQNMGIRGWCLALWNWLRGCYYPSHIEQYEKDPSKIGRDSQEALAPLVEVALKLSKMQEYTGRSAPTVIT